VGIFLLIGQKYGIFRLFIRKDHPREVISRVVVLLSERLP